MLGIAIQTERVAAGSRLCYPVGVRGDTFRLLGFFDEHRLVLTNGFAKKTEKIPSQEIELAEKRQQDYRSRRHEDE
jgi:Gp49-like protein DUF891